MHVRFSTCVGAPVVAEGERVALGTVERLLLHPDTGAVEGLFVRCSGFLQRSILFLAAADIARWGRRITVRTDDALCPLDEHIRLAALAAQDRPVIGQMVVTEEGERLGRCRDVQLSTTLLHMEWLFVRRFLRREQAIPATDIVEVRRDAVVVRSPLKGVTLREEIVPAPPTFA